ncbi:MAG: hypothetical protein A3H91_14905 [Gammaproteobacteria bacterium RIFCSPLOWO2_02_FULL_61_13]|nr:MAG: hypothetical protein A3H91_14905 [Gammaproteobacteria bacterium RIFCSPLOWO2_02_FULL_61_13]
MKLATFAGALGALLLVTAGAMAQEAESPHSFSGAAALSTDYMYRGQSQTGNNPAISGTLNYKYTSGGFADVYAGTWASNINFGGSIEIDWYGGLTGSFGDSGLGWEAGFLYYQYPGSGDGSDLDFVEAHGGLTYSSSDLPGTPSVNFKMHWSPEWQLDSGDSLYTEGNISFVLPYEFGLSGHVGHQDVDDNVTWGSPDWTEWSVYLSRAVGPVTIAVGYQDTDLDKGECYGGSNICEGRAVVTISAAF